MSRLEQTEPAPASSAVARRSDAPPTEQVCIQSNRRISVRLMTQLEYTSTNYAM